MTQFKPLPPEFYARDTHMVAQELLGKIMVRRWRNKILSGRITEVESYVGEDDDACHAARGVTARTKIMYGPAGHAYIYLIYGMYYCMNIATERTGFPAAVLIRSLAPAAGIATMKKLRRTTKLHNLTTGPGKLTQALQITRSLRGEDLTHSHHLFVVDDGYPVTSHDITTSPRIGVDYAKHCALYPWRYYLKDSDFISRK